MPSEQEEPEYIWVMQKSEISSSPEPPQLEASNWEPHCAAIQKCYQNAPWIPYNTWEFTPCNGIMHIHNCEVCTKYKEHCIIAEALAKDNESLAWKNCNKFKRDLVHLG